LPTRFAGISAAPIKIKASTTEEIQEKTDPKVPANPCSGLGT
jgi:hypothetical protein